MDMALEMTENCDSYHSVTEDFMPFSEKGFNELSDRTNRLTIDTVSLDSRVGRLETSVGRIEQSVSSFDIRLTKIETGIGIVKSIVAITAVFVLGCAVSLVNYAGKLGERVSHLEGEKGDPLGTMLKGLDVKNPQQDLSANLSLLVAQIKVDKARGKKPDPVNVEKLSNAVNQVASQNPGLPEAWEAAFSLVNLRSEEKPIQKDTGMDCLKSAFEWTPAQQFSITPRLSEEYLSQNHFEFLAKDCELDLDLKPNFDKTDAADFFVAVQTAYPKQKKVIRLINAVVRYSGGNMIPVDRIIFENCTFIFSPSATAPPKKAQSLTNQLLASDFNGGVIDLPAGM